MATPSRKAVMQSPLGPKSTHSGVTRPRLHPPHYPEVGGIVCDIADGGVSQVVSTRLNLAQGKCQQAKFVSRDPQTTGSPGTVTMPEYHFNKTMNHPKSPPKVSLLIPPRINKRGQHQSRDPRGGGVVVVVVEEEESNLINLKR